MITKSTIKKTIDQQRLILEEAKSKVVLILLKSSNISSGTQMKVKYEIFRKS